MTKPGSNLGAAACFSMELSRSFGMSVIAFLPIKKLDGRQVAANSQTVMDWKAKLLKSAVDEWQCQSLRQM